MEKISNIGAMGLLLAQQQCFKVNKDTCEAGKEICSTCPGEKAGRTRKFHNDFEISYAKCQDRLRRCINSSFCFWCTLIFLVGLLLGAYATNIQPKMIIAVIFFCIMYYFSRNKQEGRVVYGGMEEPFVFSSGITFALLGSLFASQGLEYFGFSILCFIPGIYLFFRGYKEGPLYGWKIPDTWIT